MPGVLVLVAVVLVVLVADGLKRRHVGGGLAGLERTHEPRRLVLLGLLPLDVCWLIIERREHVELRVD